MWPLFGSAATPRGMLHCPASVPVVQTSGSLPHRTEGGSAANADDQAAPNPTRNTTIVPSARLTLRAKPRLSPIRSHDSVTAPPLALPAFLLWLPGARAPQPSPETRTRKKDIGTTLSLSRNFKVQIKSSRTGMDSRSCFDVLRYLR